METRSYQELMMDYLYDELSADDKVKFENKLANDPALLQEFNELKGTRNQIGITDKELVDPFMFTTGGSGSVWMATRIIGNGILKPAIALAASISLVVLLGYFTNLSISTKDGYLSVSFGKTVQVQELNGDNYITKTQFNDLVNEVYDSRTSFSTRLAGVEDNVDMQFASLSNKSNQQEFQHLNSQNAKQLTGLATQLQKDNLKFLEQYMALSNTNQQRLIEGMLLDFSEYLEQQREEDLRSIQYSLNILKENQKLTIQETNQVLATIINKVNTQNN